MAFLHLPAGLFASRTLEQFRQMDGFIKAQFFGILFELGIEALCQRFCAVFGGGTVGVLLLTQPCTDISVRNLQRFVPKNVCIRAQEHTDAAVKIVELVTAPPHDLAQGRLRQRFRGRQQAADGPAPECLVLLLRPEKVVEPPGKSFVQTYGIILGSFQCTLFQQHFAHHFGIEEHALTAVGQGVQRSIPLGVLSKLRFQALDKIRPDVRTVLRGTAVQLNLRGVTHGLQHRRGPARQHQHPKPAGQAGRTLCQQPGQCVPLRRTALIQTIHHDGHGLLPAVHGVGNVRPQQGLEQFILGQLFQCGLVLRQGAQKILPVVRQMAGQLERQRLQHHGGVVEGVHVAAAEQIGRHAPVVVGIMHRKGTLAHRRHAAEQTDLFAVRVIQPLFHLFFQPFAPHIRLFQQGILGAGVGIDIQPLPQLLDLAVEGHILPAFQHLEQFLHLCLEPPCIRVRPLRFLFTPVGHIQPLVLPHGGRRLYLFFRPQQNAVHLAAVFALHTHRNGQLVQADAALPGGVGRQAGHHLLTVLDALLNAAPSVVPGTNIALIEPRLIPGRFPRPDGFQDFPADLTFRMPIAHKDPDRRSFIHSDPSSFRRYPVPGVSHLCASIPRFSAFRQEGRGILWVSSTSSLFFLLARFLLRADGVCVIVYKEVIHRCFSGGGSCYA